MKKGAGTLAASFCVAAAWLIMPALALHRRGVDMRWAAVYLVLVSAIAYGVNARDKRLAQGGEWRVSEATLHFWEMIGGWPGAWIAQRRLRHKTSKRSYQVILWLILFVHQFTAIDSMREWQITRAGWQWVQHNLATGRR